MLRHTPRESSSRKIARTWGGLKLLHRLVLVLVLAVLLFPIYWLILTSMASPDRIISGDVRALLPEHLVLSSYRFVLATSGFTTYIKNSAFVAGVVTIVGVGVSSLAAYGLSRLGFPGSRLLGRLVLFAYIVPPVLLAVPMFVALSKLGLVNTPIALILAHLALVIPFCVWILRGFFLSLPSELEDAAAVDGCTPLGAFLLIVLPLSSPGLVAAAMFAFLLSWNEFFYALVFLLSNSQMTLPVGIRSTYFNNSMGPSDWIHLLSASVIACIPVFALFGALQRWMVGGLTAGSVRG